MDVSDLLMKYDPIPTKTVNSQLKAEMKAEFIWPPAKELYLKGNVIWQDYLAKVYGA